MLENKEVVTLSTEETSEENVEVTDMAKASDLDFYGFSKGESDEPQAEAEDAEAEGKDASEDPEDQMEKMMRKMMEENLAKMMEDKESSLYKMLRKMMDEEKESPEMDKALPTASTSRGRDKLLEWLNK